MTAAGRPALRAPEIEDTVHIYIGPDTDFNHANWPELALLRASTHLTIEAYGPVSVAQAIALAPNGDVSALMGVKTDQQEPVSVFNIDDAYRIAVALANAVRRHQLGNLRVIDRSELSYPQMDIMIQTAVQVMDDYGHFDQYAVEPELAHPARRGTDAVP